MSPDLINELKRAEYKQKKAETRKKIQTIIAIAFAISMVAVGDQYKDDCENGATKYLEVALLWLWSYWT